MVENLILTLPSEEEKKRVLQKFYEARGGTGSYLDHQKESVEKVEIYEIYQGRKLVGSFENHFMTPRRNTRRIPEKFVYRIAKELCPNATRVEFVRRMDLENLERDFSGNSKEIIEIECCR